MDDALLISTPVVVSIAALHTLSGPDHYLPFIAMAKAGEWSRVKTIWITSLCGLGHVASSVLLALIGSAALLGAGRLAGLESLRGDLAAWGLIAFGLVYAAWGFRRARRRVPHRHSHIHGDGTVHEHRHDHTGEHSHVHPQPGRTSLTPWVLFTIFVFGPCEPLIPLLMYPATQESVLGFLYVATLFTAVTVGCMLGAVLLGLLGLRTLRWNFAERHAHTYAGVAILACGLAMKYLGL